MADDVLGAVRSVAVQQAAPSLGADPAALLDSVAFVKTLDRIDASAPGFHQRIGEAITAAVQANPVYRAAGSTVAARPATPDAPADTGLTLEDVGRMTPAQVVEAGEAGQLAHHGYVPRKRARR